MVIAKQSCFCSVVQGCPAPCNSMTMYVPKSRGAENCAESIIQLCRWRFKTYHTLTLWVSMRLLGWSGCVYILLTISVIHPRDLDIKAHVSIVRLPNARAGLKRPEAGSWEIQHHTHVSWLRWTGKADHLQNPNTLLNCANRQALIFALLASRVDVEVAQTPERL